MSERKRWWIVLLFAAAMAWVESAVVLYLRTLVDRIEPYQAMPLPERPELGWVELVRELATLIMLGTVGTLAGRTWRSRLAYAVVIFGAWDILYYVFLRLMCGWPHGLLDWDILFLIPLPWWGPVWAPVSIAVLLVIGGTLVTRLDTPESPFWPRRTALVSAGAGATLALYVFMADALAVLDQGAAAVVQVLPRTFQWPLFLIAWALMAMPVFELASRAAARTARSARQLESQPS